MTTTAIREDRLTRLAALLTGIVVGIGAVVLAAQGGSQRAQPAIGARVKPVLTVDGRQFKDANGDGQLEAPWDWRLSVDERVRDLVSTMTLEEKCRHDADRLAEPGRRRGEVTPADAYLRETEDDALHLPRSVVTATPSTAGGQRGGGRFGSVHREKEAGRWPAGRRPGRRPAAPGGQPGHRGMQAAVWTNNIQAMAEGTRLGIPVIFKSNARNHYERAARFGINTEAGIDVGMAEGSRDWRQRRSGAHRRLRPHHGAGMAVDWPARHVRLHGGCRH